MTTKTGWGRVGIDHDPAQCAVASIRRWGVHRGRALYPEARKVLIPADGGGRNASRSRLWKVALQGRADETGLRIHVCHFPPGTSKGNNMAHRMCCHLPANWRGRLLIDPEVIVQFIGPTTTTTGWAIQAELDHPLYPTGLAISDQQMKELNWYRATFHGEDWNDLLKPRG